MKNRGKLYIVPTPIGNLADMTFRAIDTLKSVALIGAEDTRTSAKLMKHYNIGTKMISYHKFNERARVDKFKAILNNGEDVAIISDAGTPGISDPASIIISEVLKDNFEVETLPGATAFVPAIVSSGLNCDSFYFVGFLPDKHLQKQQKLLQLANIKNSLIFYESPHRLHKFLNLLLLHLGDRKCAIARELSKLYETYYRTSLKIAVNNPDDIILKGEFVIIVEGATNPVISDAEIVNLLEAEIESGNSKTNAVKVVCNKTGLKRNRIYDLALKL